MIASYYTLKNTVIESGQDMTSPETLPYSNIATLETLIAEFKIQHPQLVASEKDLQSWLSELMDKAKADSFDFSYDKYDRTLDDVLSELTIIYS